MIFDTFLTSPAMEQHKREKINAIPAGIQWRSRVGHVLFRDPKTRLVYIVQGMTIAGCKGAWSPYKRVFKGRTFTISLNAGGEGVHYAEGIRWDNRIKTWVNIPMPNPYLSVVAQGAFEKPSSILIEYVWDTSSSSWLCDERDVKFHLFRLSETNRPLNCWEHRLDAEPCHCEGIDDLRTQFDGFTILVECRVCYECHELYSEQSCPTCPKFFIRKSLHGIENKCSICLEDNGLDKCVAVRSSFLSRDCSHSFHQSCITKWFADGNESCPICRHEHKMS